MPVHQLDDLRKIVPQRRLAAGENDVLDAGIDRIGKNSIKLFQVQLMRRFELPNVAHRASRVASQVHVDMQHRRSNHFEPLPEMVLVQVAGY
jgi:hypothetical protein